jgi:3-isopropylmalate dehydrogenase
MTNSPEKTWKIAVLPGDGIGIEVMAEGIKVLRAVMERVPGLSCTLREYPVGAGAYLKYGDPLPEESFEACKSADAILLGAMGIPSVRWPDGRELTPQIDLRERLDLYFGLRPIKLYHPSDAAICGPGATGIDLAIVRENTEGLMSGRLRPQTSSDRATDELLVTQKASERLFHATFKEARKRRKKVTLVDKANVLPSMVFFRKVFDEVALYYPDVETDRIYVDAASLYLVRRPNTFDVMVTENMFGDIISDLAAGLVGGMGMAPSADIGDTYAVFQPSHGSAPDIAGKGIANPVATILSVAMMLEWLPGEAAHKAAKKVYAAVTEVLSNPANRTPDLRGKMTTSELGTLVERAVLEQE